MRIGIAQGDEESPTNRLLIAFRQRLRFMVVRVSKQVFHYGRILQPLMLLSRNGLHDYGSRDVKMEGCVLRQKICFGLEV